MVFADKLVGYSLIHYRKSCRCESKYIITRIEPM